MACFSFAGCWLQCTKLHIERDVCIDCWDSSPGPRSLHNVARFALAIWCLEPLRIHSGVQRRWQQRVLSASAVGADCWEPGAQGAFRGLGKLRVTMAVSLVVAVTNIALDPLLMFAWGMGIKGAGVATAAAQWLGAGLYVYLLAAKHPQLRVFNNITIPTVEQVQAQLASTRPEGTAPPSVWRKTSGCSGADQA